MPYNSAHHCVVEVENFLLLLGGEDQWNPNGTVSPQTALQSVFHFVLHVQHLIIYLIQGMPSTRVYLGSDPSELM